MLLKNYKIYLSTWTHAKPCSPKRGFHILGSGSFDNYSIVLRLNWCAAFWMFSAWEQSLVKGPHVALPCPTGIFEENPGAAWVTSGYECGFRNQEHIKNLDTASPFTEIVFFNW